MTFQDARTITVHIRDVDGEPMFSLEGVELLFGVPAELITVGTPFPQEWIKAGRRRAREAMAATGSDFVLDIMRYWAQKDHGAALEIVEDVS